jgi:hypothetical protein
MFETGVAERSLVIAVRIKSYTRTSVFLVVIIFMGLGSSYLGLSAQSDTLAHVYLVGAGIARAGTGHHINRATRITVLEASDRAGGEYYLWKWQLK